MYEEIKSYCEDNNVELVAVSKTKSNSEILEIYNKGQRVFGENRVQELRGKYEDLPKNIHWHLIGHLQSNKVKYIAPFVTMIHSVDSFDLARMIDKQAKKHDRIIDILLQFKIAKETSKFGLDESDILDFLENKGILQLKNIRIRGLMAMASFTNDEDQLSQEFTKAQLLFKKLKLHFFANDSKFNILSMGMSGDYQLAIEKGSNMVRVGSLIFGNRY